MQAKAEPSGQDGSVSVRKYPRNEYIYIRKGRKYQPERRGGSELQTTEGMLSSEEEQFHGRTGIPCNS